LNKQARPSEEKINGKSYEMAVHLELADEKGNMAVVAILLEKGEDNALGPCAPRRRPSPERS
jgi:carbonic anhydrase